MTISVQTLFSQQIIQFWNDETNLKTRAKCKKYYVRVGFVIHMWALLNQLIRPPRTTPAPPMITPTTIHCLFDKNPDAVFSDFSVDGFLSTSRPSIRFDIRSSTIRFFFRRSVNLFRKKRSKKIIFFVLIK